MTASKMVGGKEDIIKLRNVRRSASQLAVYSQINRQFLEDNVRSNQYIASHFAMLLLMVTKVVKDRDGFL